MKPLSELQPIARDLCRPECVLSTAKGNFYVSDFRGGVTKIKANGEQEFYGGPLPSGEELKPNGIALCQDGSFLVAHLGDEEGGIYRITRDSEVQAFATEIDGQRMPPSNFIYLDCQGRLWFTVSTRHRPRAAAYRSDIADGFIGVIENGEATIVADGIGYTNEVYVTPDGKYLYVNATFSQELLRFTITPENRLSDKIQICRFGDGTFPDGLTMDSEGQLWVTSIVSNRVLRVDPSTGQQTIYLEENEGSHLNAAVEAFKHHQLARPHLDINPGKILRNISSLAFHGPSLDHMVLGCLLGTQLVTTKSEYKGLPPAHWGFD